MHFALYPLAGGVIRLMLRLLPFLLDLLMRLRSIPFVCPVTVWSVVGVLVSLPIGVRRLWILLRWLMRLLLIASGVVVCVSIMIWFM